MTAQTTKIGVCLNCGNSNVDSRTDADGVTHQECRGCGIEDRSDTPGNVFKVVTAGELKQLHDAIDN